MSARFRHVRALIVSAALALAFAPVLALPTSAWSSSVYNSAYNQSQETRCNCVPASARVWIRYTRSEFGTPSQQQLHGYMSGYDAKDWSNSKCLVSEGNPYVSTPHDARGWAYAMWEYATANESIGFNHYRFSSQALANWELVWGIRATAAPVGVIAKAGKHAILAVGYNTDYDPWKPQVSEIYGFRIWDPWYESGFGNIGFRNWPDAGYTQNKYVTLSTWNTYIFKRDVNEGSYYKDANGNGYYVAVLRKLSVSAPSEALAPMSYGEYEFNQHGGGPGALSMDDGGASVITAESIDEALSAGLTANDLTNDSEFGDLSTYTIGTVLEVHSLVREVPSYALVEVRVSDELRGVALMMRMGDGYAFGALKRTRSDGHLPTSSELNDQAQLYGLEGRPRLVWTITPDADNPPFVPMLEAVDPATGRAAFVTSAGVVDDLRPADGLTRR